MNRKNIQKLCMFFVLPATAAFTLWGCSVGKNGVDGNNTPTPTTKTVNASNFTNANRELNRLHIVQDRMSVQHR